LGSGDVTPIFFLNLIRGLVQFGDKLVALHKSAVFTFMNKNYAIML